MKWTRKFLLLMVLLLSSILLVSACTLGSPGGTVRTELVTVVFVITQAPDPNASPEVIIVTATPDRTQVAVPDNIVGGGSGQQTTPQAGVTALPDAADLEGVDDVSGIPAGCILHTIADGDTIFALAEEYGVDGFTMLEANGLTEDDAVALQIGDTIIVPIEGCPIEEIVLQADDDSVEATEESTAEATAEQTESPEDLTPTVTPTITLAPTATDSEVEIVEVQSAGDVTAESVSIRNNGLVLDVTGWTLSDQDGNEYVFDEQLVFSNSVLTLYTFSGQDTPISRYWGLEISVWQPGDVVTLQDARSAVQAVYRIPTTP